MICCTEKEAILELVKVHHKACTKVYNTHKQILKKVKSKPVKEWVDAAWRPCSPGRSALLYIENYDEFLRPCVNCASWEGIEQLVDGYCTICVKKMYVPEGDDCIWCGAHSHFRDLKGNVTCQRHCNQ